jgi:hypothetical protein
VCALRERETERERELHLQLVCLQERVLKTERRRLTVVRFFKELLQEDKVKCFVFAVGLRICVQSVPGLGYRVVKSRIVSFCCSRKQILITFLPGRVCGPSFDVRESFCLFLITSLCLRSRGFLLNRFGRRASVCNLPIVILEKAKVLQDLCSVSTRFCELPNGKI